MTVVSEQAERIRLDSMLLASNNTAIRSATRRNMAKIDEACRHIVEARDELSLVNVVRTLSQLFPGDHPAEQSIRNSSRSGESYREVVAIWRTYTLAVAKTKKIKPISSVEDDLPDIVLNQIHPEGARMVVLAMRTSLRNMRRQIHALKQITPERLIRHPTSGDEQEAIPAFFLNKEEHSILLAFTDTSETVSRGLEWDDLGRLLDADRKALSRPGLLQVLNRILATDASSSTTAKPVDPPLRKPR